MISRRCHHNTAHMTPPPLAYTPTPPVLATMEPLDTFLMGDKVISTIPKRENDEFIKSSVDDLVPIPRESESTLDSTNLECSMPIVPPLPCIDVLEDTIIERLLADNPIPVLRVFDEPLGNSDSVPRSYDVTFSNPLVDFNNYYTLCYDNPLFDEEFKDISIRGSVRGSDKEASRKADVAHCGCDQNKTAANDEVRVYENERNLKFIDAFDVKPIGGFELDNRNMLLDTVKDVGIIKDGVYATYVTVVTNLQDEMIDMMDISNEIQEAIGRSKNMPHDIDEDELLGALALAGENSESVNPLITRIRNRPVGIFHDKMDASLDPIKELSSHHELIHGEKMELGRHSVTRSLDEPRWSPNGLDHMLEKKLWARVRQSVSCYGRKRISEKRTKNQAKTDKTKHGVEKRGKAKVKSKPKSTKVKIKVNPEKSTVNTEADIEEY
ncbi:NAC domain-containing protein [Tanacetum coccineum]